MEKFSVSKADVLIIGSGGAGLRAAIELFDKNIDVQVVGKCKRREAHTIMATGGINAALGNMDKNDSWQLHAADTIRDGGWINDAEAVKLLCKNAPRAIKELAKWGTRFHREKDNRISQRFFGAATYRRACFVGDHTGKEILNVLVNQAHQRKIKFASEIYIFGLLHKKGKVNGAIGLDSKNGKIKVFHAKIVILATGGHSRMFRRSSSRFWENNGDGVYLTYKLGGKFMDMEMFQFHPTGMLSPPEADGLLVTEAVRGEGGKLTNKLQDRFMKQYDPQRMELSARDVVARAIYMEVKAGRGTRRGGVWLDISHRSKSYILRRLPKMYHQFMHYLNVDISKQKMEVAPTAHYSMGGINVDHKTGKTGIANLYAIGEVTSGVHGGNRLGGNSLAEIIVFGRLTAEQARRNLKRTKWISLDEEVIAREINELKELTGKKSGKDPIKVKKQLQELMWKKAGVVRNEKDLQRGLKELGHFRKYIPKVPSRLKMNEKLIAALDVRNMIPICEMIIKCALQRKESRAAHFRSDYPRSNAKWKKNIICYPSNNTLKIVNQRTKPIPSEILKHLRKSAKVSKELLE